MPTIEIESDVPLTKPKSGRTPNLGEAFKLDKVEVGQSVLITGTEKDARSVLTAVSSRKRHLGETWVSRLDSEGSDPAKGIVARRFWRTA